MNGVELLDALVVRTGYPEEEIRKIAGALWEEIAREVADGNRVLVRNFGVFERHTRKAKIAQDFGKGRSIEVPEKYFPRFRPSENFVNRVREAGDGIGYEKKD